MAKHPQILSIQTRGPVLITDLTSLHPIYPISRSHLLWEQLTGIPETLDESPIAQRSVRDKRRRKKKKDFDFGTFQQIHCVGFNLCQKVYCYVLSLLHSEMRSIIITITFYNHH